MSGKSIHQLGKLKSRRIDELFDDDGETLNRLLKRVGKIRKIRDVSFIPDIVNIYADKFPNPYSRMFIPIEMVDSVLSSRHFVDDDDSLYAKFLSGRSLVPCEFYPSISFSVFVISSGKPVFRNKSLDGVIKTFNVQYIVENILCK